MQKNPPKRAVERLPRGTLYYEVICKCKGRIIRLQSRYCLRPEVRLSERIPLRYRLQTLRLRPLPVRRRLHRSSCIDGIIKSSSKKLSNKFSLKIAGNISHFSFRISDGRFIIRPCNCYVCACCRLFDSDNIIRFDLRCGFRNGYL